jgi:thiol-disulfide isomerase/thioredoxin
VRAFALSCLALIFAAPIQPAAQPPVVIARDTDGKAIQLPEAGTVTVVQFMATWCAPCHEQTKSLVELHPSYAPRGVRFVAVSVDRAAEHKLLPVYVEDFKVPYPIHVGGTVEQLDRFGFGDTLPAVIVFDKDGQIFDRLMGLVAPEVLTARLDWLTGDRAAPRPPPFVPPKAEREEDELPHAHARESLAKQEGRRPGSLVPS